MPIYCQTSTGERITEATIKTRLGKAYREKYEGEPSPCCESCGEQAQGSAHPIPKSRLKQLHLADYIYNPRFFFPACHKCNLAWEVPAGEEWKTSLNKEEVLELIQEFDPELYTKFV